MAKHFRIFDTYQENKTEKEIDLGTWSGLLRKHGGNLVGCFSMAAAGGASVFTIAKGISAISNGAFAAGTGTTVLGVLAAAALVTAGSAYVAKDFKACVAVTLFSAFLSGSGLHLSGEALEQSDSALGGQILEPSSGGLVSATHGAHAVGQISPRLVV